MALSLATLIENGIPISLGCAVVGLVFALWLIKSLLSISSGTDKMKFIANAIEQGAKAYLSRQLASISVIGIAIAALLFGKRTRPLRSDSSSAQCARSRRDSSACASR